MKNGLNKILAILMLYSAVSLFSNAENDAMKHDTIDYIENTQFVFSYPSLSREVCGGEGECIYKSITCKDDGVFLVFGRLHNTINSFDFQLINKAEFRDKYSTTKCGSYHNQDSIIQVYNQDTLTRYYREDIYKSGIDVYYFNAKEQDTIKYNKILDSVKSQIYSIEDSLAKSKLKQDNCYEKKFSSPYAYCAANPIRYIDPTGNDWIAAFYNNYDFFYYYDSEIHSQEDVYNKYGDNTDILYQGDNLHLIYSDNKSEIDLKLLPNGFYLKDDKVLADEYDSGTGLHIGSDKFTKSKTVISNWYGSYLGPNNPQKYLGENKDSYAVPPIDRLNYAAYNHDKAYDINDAHGIGGALFSSKVKQADHKLAVEAFIAAKYASNLSQRKWAILTGTVFSIIQGWK